MLHHSFDPSFCNKRKMCYYALLFIIPLEKINVSLTLLKVLI
nr:MAG TPA: hypothetical protein [Caudoviricetes sp.]